MGGDQMQSTSRAERLAQSPEPEDLGTTTQMHPADYSHPDRVAAQAVAAWLFLVAQEATADSQGAEAVAVAQQKPEPHRGPEEQAERALQS